MQDDFNRMLRNSMRQAMNGYEEMIDMMMGEPGQGAYSPSEEGCSACGEPTREEPVCHEQSGNAVGKCCAGQNTDTSGNCAAEQNTGMSGNCAAEQNTVMVFIEPQRFGSTYNEATGLQRGTLFPALDKPFTGGGRHC